MSCPTCSECLDVFCIWLSILSKHSSSLGKILGAGSNPLIEIIAPQCIRWLGSILHMLSRHLTSCSSYTGWEKLYKGARWSIYHLIYGYEELILGFGFQMVIPFFLVDVQSQFLRSSALHWFAVVLIVTSQRRPQTRNSDRSIANQ